MLHAVESQRLQDGCVVHHKESIMKMLIRAIAGVAIIWLAMLLTGYGVLTGSTKNAAGLGLQCSYLTARGVINAQYLHTDSGIIGVTECPLLKKSGDVIDN